MSCNHFDKKHCVYYYTKSHLMKKDGGCKSCKHGFTINKFICSHCKQEVRTKVKNGTHSQHTQISLPWEYKG